VLDDDLPAWVPIPALAEVQVAVQDAVAEVTGLEGYDLKRIMRTGTVATIDNRNWELATSAGRCSACRSRAPSPSTWNRPPSPPTASASACPTARCSASPTSRCMASSSCPAWPRRFTRRRSTSISDRAAGHGETRRHAARTAAFAQAEKLLRDRISVEFPCFGPWRCQPMGRRTENFRRTHDRPGHMTEKTELHTPYDGSAPPFAIGLARLIRRPGSTLITIIPVTSPKSDA
jgi:hypothetical protein